MGRRRAARGRAGRTDWLPPAAAPPCRRPSRRPARAVRTGHCGESGFAFTVAAARHSSVSARRRAAGFGAHEVRDALARLREACDPGLVKVRPHLLTERGLGCEQPRVTAGVVIMSSRSARLPSSRHRSRASHPCVPGPDGSHFSALTAEKCSPSSRRGDRYSLRVDRGDLTGHQIASLPHGSPVHRGRRGVPRRGAGLAGGGPPVGAVGARSQRLGRPPRLRHGLAAHALRRRVRRASTGPRSTAAAAPRPPST